MDERPGLDDHRDARFAWARYRRILGYMNLVSIAVGAAVVAFFWMRDPTLPWLFALFIFIGVYGTLILGAALMGLMFLSNGTGHDAHVIDRMEGSHPIDD